jgi:type IV pilus assembly protein PilY1
MTLATFDAGDADDDGIYDSNSTIRKGNRLNYDNLSDPGNRLAIAKTVTKQIIDDTYQQVRLGIILLHGDVGWDTNPGYNANFPGYHKDSSVLSPSNGASPIQEWDDDGGATDKDVLKGYVDLTTASGCTPLAVRLINAAQYFKHEDSNYFGTFGATGGFDDPITAETWCRKNYIILVTDGQPTYEGDTTYSTDQNEGQFDYIENFLPTRTDTALEIPGVNGHGQHNYDYDATDNADDWDPWGSSTGNRYTSDVGGGSDYLDDVAKYLYDTDLRPEPTIPGKQNITTFTIGFTVDDDLLQDTADNGGGTYQTASSAAALEQALRNAMGLIVDRAQTFTAPVVPVQRTTSGDKMYISLFTPRSSAIPPHFWPGYLVKLKIGSNGELTGFASDYGTGAEVQVTDSEGNLSSDLLRSDHAPYPYWDAQHVLRNTNVASRNIYSYLNVSKDLDHSSNAFLTTNSTNLTDQTLGNPSDRDTLIKYMRGVDVYDEDGDSDVTDNRIEILGDILHSKPLIVDYEASNTSNPNRVIYVGTNDGMLHAFDDTNGSEKWAFIPPDLLPKLKDIVEGTTHPYYVDGSPQAYIKDVDGDGDIEDGDGDQVIIIFGERRGGTSYCALDVTDPDDPQFLWRIDNIDNSATYGIPAPDLVIAEMGQSWSDPVIGKVKAGTVGSETDTIVACISGGYSSDNTKGRAFYLINVLDGSLVKGFTSTDHASLTYSIPSTVLAVDTTFDSYINRVYVGDLGGQMWRFGYQRADASDTTLEDGNVNNWAPRRFFAITGTTAKKIFYTPDLVLEPGYAYLYFGTGDRTNPMDRPSPVTGNEDRFYAVKDKNDHNDPAFTTLTEADLYDATDNLIQDGDAAQQAAAAAALAAGDGWYITLDETNHDGEKVLAPPTVIFGMVLFTTFTPVDTSDPSNLCSFGGDARLYAVDYLTAASLIDWGSDGLDKTDRAINIGQGIPTEVVITLTDTGDVRGYVGAGGGIIHWDFTGSVPRFSVDAWREEF